MKKQIIITILLTIGVCAGYAQVLTLDSILSEIQNRNPAIRMFDADIRSADEAAKGARSWDAPEFGTGFFMTPYNTKYWKKEDNGNFGMGQYMIAAQQMFPNKKRQDAEERYLSSVSSADVDRKKAVLNQYYAAAKRNYYEWVILKKKAAVLDDNEKLLQFMIQSAEIRYKNGLGKLNAYYKAKAALGNIENMRIVLENEITQRRIALNALMNRDQHLSFDVDSTLPELKTTTSNFDSTTFIQGRSDIRAIEKDIQINYLQQSAELATLKPQFGIRYEHMFGFGGPMQFSLLGTMRMPLTNLSTRAARANAESLKWKVESLSQQRQSLINEATGQAYGMLSNIEQKKRQLKLFENNIIPSLRKNLQSLQLAYEQNTEELFTLFDAWETLNMTQLEYLQQLQELMVMQVELEKILETK